MSNRDYWQKRFILLEESQINKGTAYYHELEKQYRKAAGEIEKELSKWYARLAVNNELSIAEAKKILDRDELQEFHWTVEEYIEKGRTLNISDQWAKQLENASAKVHISRYEALKLQMQQQIEVLYGNELDSMDKFMRDIYTESYYRTAFEIQKGLGVGSDFMRLNDKKVSQIIAKPWAADGSNFSSRLWKQKAQLVTELQNQITQDMAIGRSPQESIKAIKDRFKVSSGQAGRLVMTETAFFHSAAQKDTFNKLNVEEYEIVATLDNKTSDICRNMDGKHMPMSEFKPGITAPPFHCWCRSTTVPYFDDEFTIGETRAARNEETGKSYEVPANMTYPEWKETFVDGGSKDGLKTAMDTVAADIAFNVRPNSTITAKQQFEDTMAVSEAYKNMPLKVRQTFSDVIFEFGYDRNECDIANKSIHVGIGTKIEHINHEFGHLIEKYMMDKKQVDAYKKALTKGLTIANIKKKTYYDSVGNPVDIFVLDGGNFESEYQTRIYVSKISDAINNDGTINTDFMLEIISEPFRKYMNNEPISDMARKLIEGAIL